MIKNQNEINNKIMEICKEFINSILFNSKMFI